MQKANQIVSLRKSACFALQYRLFWRAKQALLQRKTMGIAKCCRLGGYEGAFILQILCIFVALERGVYGRWCKWLWRSFSLSTDF